jgi:MFS family permease
VRSPWITLAVSFVVLAVYRVVSSSFSILVLPLEAELAVSRATVMLIFTAHMVVYSFASLLCGVAIDRFGPRPTILVGGILIGIGLVAMSAAQTLTGLALAFGLACGAGVAMIGLPANFMILNERFTTRIATAMGIAAAGMGVGVLIFIPAIQFVADRAGWRTALLWTGCAATVLIVICSWLQRRRPDGSAGPRRAATPSAPFSPSIRARMMEVARSPKWQGVGGANFLMGSALFGVLTHQVALLREAGWSAMAAAAALGWVNVFRSAGGPLWGMVLDRFGRRVGYGISTAIGVAGIICFAFAQTQWSPGVVLAYCFIVAFGIGSGGTIPANASLANELFSPKQRAIAWGFTETAYAGGAAFGSWAAGWLFDLTGDYTVALAAAAVQTVASYGLVLMLSPRRAAKQTAARA